jgi:hypothetical protein
MEAIVELTLNFLSEASPVMLLALAVFVSATFATITSRWL